MMMKSVFWWRKPEYPRNRKPEYDLQQQYNMEQALFNGLMYRWGSQGSSGNTSQAPQGVFKMPNQTPVAQPIYTQQNTVPGSGVYIRMPSTEPDSE